MAKISLFPGSLPDIGTLPPLNSDTILVTSSLDLRGTAQFDKSKIVFAGTDFARLALSSIQFGNGNISETVAITGDSFRNFIDVHLDNGDTSFSAAGWTFQNFVPFNPLEHDQVTIHGSAAADTITGSSMADGLIGGDGNDTLSGLDGRDILIGGAGADTLAGGLGDDQYRLDTIHFVDLPLVSVDTRSRFAVQLPLFSAYDTVIEGADGGTDTVLVTPVGGLSRYSLGVHVENGVVTGTGIFSLTGNGLANKLTGNGDANTLSGLDGADTLSGGGGNDHLEGGRGSDLLLGEAGTDTASYASALSGVTVNLATTVAQVTGQGADILIGIENLLGSRFEDELRGDDAGNTLMGAAGADILGGGEGRDILIGGGGADSISGGRDLDIIDGGGGNDALTGGGGGDTFVFAPGSGDDAILDFTDLGGPSDDVIDLDAFNIGRVADIARSASGDDLVLTLAPGDTLVIRDYLLTHALSDINDDIISPK